MICIIVFLNIIYKYYVHVYYVKYTHGGIQTFLQEKGKKLFFGQFYWNTRNNINNCTQNIFNLQIEQNQFSIYRKKFLNLFILCKFYFKSFHYYKFVDQHIIYIFKFMTQTMRLLNLHSFY